MNPFVLPADKRALVAEIVEALAGLPGVAAIVLGGSYARGVARSDSDVDLGVYYDEERPLRIDDVRAVATRFQAAGTPTVTDFYEWGPWVNGGAWLETRAGRVDFLYRAIGHVERVIAAAQRGEVEWHFWQQPAYGFRSVIYLAETAICRPLHDPSGVVARLQREVEVYPEALRLAIVRGSLWSAEFTLQHLRKFAAIGDAYNAAGCVTRIACELTQVLFALNRLYFISDKGALEAIEDFAVKPDGYSARMQGLLSHPTALITVDRLAEIISDVVDLTEGIYAAKYRLPS